MKRKPSGKRIRGEAGRSRANGYSATGCVVPRGPWENRGGEVKAGEQGNKCWTIIRTCIRSTRGASPVCGAKGEMCPLAVNCEEAVEVNRQLNLDPGLPLS